MIVVFVVINPSAHAQRRVIVVGQCVTVPVSVSICLSHVFSRTVAVVDTKHGYVGRYNGRSAKQESGEVSKKSVFSGC